MSFAKRLFRDCPILAIGGTGIWMLTNSFRGDKESRGGTNLSFNLGRFVSPKGASSVRQKTPLKPKPEAPQPAELKVDNGTLETGDPAKVPEVPKEIPGPQDNLKKPGGAPTEPKKLGRSDDGEEEDGLVTEEKDATNDPKQQISDVGLKCGNTTTETDCTILEGGINVDKGNGKKEGYVLSGGENGKIRFRLSEETTTYSDGFKFTITGKSITLHKKDNPSDTITLEKYESYGLEKDSNTNTIYLTRKLNANEGMIKSLGLPKTCTLPTTVSTDVFDYGNPKSTCQIPKNQIQSINFDGKKAGQTASGGSSQLYLYIQKVGDTTTYNKGGYKFFLHSDEDLNLPDGVKLTKKVWWDFRLKDPDADDLVLEKVWRNEDELLNKIGLSCKKDGTCSINNNSLKIKINGKVIENGKKKEGDGTIYLEKNKSGYYEGLKFSVWGEKGMTIVDSNSPLTTLEMKEFEIYHITKESNTPAFYLTRKEKAEDMIGIHLGMKSCPPNPDRRFSRNCTAAHPDLWSQFKFYDGEKEQTISRKNNADLSISISISSNTSFPFGYKYSLNPSKEINIGRISLPHFPKGVKKSTDFKIRRDVKSKKLYLEKASK